MCKAHSTSSQVLLAIHSHVMAWFPLTHDEGTAQCGVPPRSLCGQARARARYCILLPPSLYRPSNLRSIVIIHQPLTVATTNKYRHIKPHIMSAPSASRLLTQATRTASRSIIRSRQANAFHLQPCRVVPAIRAVNCSRTFSVSASKATGLMPDTENPSTPKREPLATTLTPAEITDEEFHTLSDAFLEKVHEKAEQVQEGREDVEVDYSVST